MIAAGFDRYDDRSTAASGAGTAAPQQRSKAREVADIFGEDEDDDLGLGDDDDDFDVPSFLR